MNVSITKCSKERLSDWERLWDWDRFWDWERFLDWERFFDWERFLDWERFWSSMYRYFPWKLEISGANYLVRFFIVEFLISRKLDVPPQVWAQSAWQRQLKRVTILEQDILLLLYQILVYVHALKGILDLTHWLHLELDWQWPTSTWPNPKIHIFPI